MRSSPRLLRYGLIGLLGSAFLYLSGGIVSYLLVALTGWGWLFSLWQPLIIGLFVVALVLLFVRKRRV